VVKLVIYKLLDNEGQCEGRTVVMVSAFESGRDLPVRSCEAMHWICVMVIRFLVVDVILLVRCYSTSTSILARVVAKMVLVVIL
jgi:hypothetical protein